MYLLLRLVIQVPVSVAKSNTNFGDNESSKPRWTEGTLIFLVARVKVSARSKRPSASVLTISIVVPDSERITSSGRYASIPMLFSARANQHSTG